MRLRMYRDVLVARGTDLWNALEEKDDAKAKAAYDAAEAVFRRHVPNWPELRDRMEAYKKQWTNS